jgi:Ca2+-transporting ATPase/DNA polymerase kappa
MSQSCVIFVFFVIGKCRNGSPLYLMDCVIGSLIQARKFGVRAAMPGFIGCKLCPGLVFVRPNFERYTHYSELTRKGL